MQFAVLRSSDGADEYYDWGTSSDVLVPGDFTGDGRSDFMIARENPEVVMSNGGCLTLTE